VLLPRRRLKLARGTEDKGEHLMSQNPSSGRRHWHRYRQELILCRWSGSTWRHRTASKVVARPGRSTAGQDAALPDRHGGLCRCASPQSQAQRVWARCATDTGEVCAPLLEGTEERSSAFRGDIGPTPEVSPQRGERCDGPNRRNPQATKTIRARSAVFLAPSFCEILAR